MRRLIGLILILVMSVGQGASVDVVVAQDDQDSCGELVDLALAQTADVCQDIGRNRVCYGNVDVDATLFDDVTNSAFSTPGDRLALDRLETLRTAALDEATQTWGVALLSVQANLPETTPGQNVTFVVFGDAQLAADDAASGYDAPMQAFRLSTGIGPVRCEAAPQDGMLIQAPTDTSVVFSINGVEVNVGSTAYISQVEDDQLDISTLDGTLEVESDGASVVIEPGNWARVRPDEPPDVPVPYPNERVRNLPVDLLPEPVVVPLNVIPSESWTNTGIALAAGQSYTVEASGESRIWPGCGDFCTGDFCAELCPALVAGPDGSVPIGEIVPESSPYMTLPDVPIVALLGRIGENGEPFFIGASGAFTAETDGDLFLIVNEDERVRGDETGSFTVRISLQDEESTD